MQKNYTSAEARFWKYVDIGDGNGCWLWTGCKTRNGYGRLAYAPARSGWILSHRFSWILHHGPIPAGAVVRHAVCAHPGCVRPDHLAIGTVADNAADTVRMGRTAKGERSGPGRHPEKMIRGEQHYRAQLTEADVRSIRSRYRSDLRNAAKLAREFGISESTVSSIVRGKSWRHLL